MMKTKNRIKAAGIIVIILGSIHLAVTPVALKMLNALHKMTYLTFAYMFVCTGVALLFTGWIQYYLAKQPGVSEKDNKIIAASVYFMIIVGIGAVTTMWNNPFSYIFLLVALYELYQVRTLNYLIKNQTDKVVS